MTIEEHQVQRLGGFVVEALVEVAAGALEFGVEIVAEVLCGLF